MGQTVPKGETKMKALIYTRDAKDRVEGKIKPVEHHVSKCGECPEVYKSLEICQRTKKPVNLNELSPRCPKVIRQ